MLGIIRIRLATRVAVLLTLSGALAGCVSGAHHSASVQGAVAPGSAATPSVAETRRAATGQYATSAPIAPATPADTLKVAPRSPVTQTSPDSSHQALTVVELGASDGAGGAAATRAAAPFAFRYQYL